MKRLGASVDWQREYFTMDDTALRGGAGGVCPPVRAGTDLSRRIHRELVPALPDRASAIWKWCTTNSKGKLWEIRYPCGWAGPASSITVATTRPETMLGDVAVAVHPEDERYLHLHGKKLRLPLREREIPVVTRRVGEPRVRHRRGEGDSGARSQRLRDRRAPPSAVDQRDGRDRRTSNAAAGAYAGLDRYEARKKIVEDLEEQGLLVGDQGPREPRRPLRPLQDGGGAAAFDAVVRQDSAAGRQGDCGGRARAHQVHAGAIFEKTYFEWMQNIHDWCISRQLWWGHRIPAWHCATCHKITVARETPTACAHCGSDRSTQETDVLDTWFSSGLLPVHGVRLAEHHG